MCIFGIILAWSDSLTLDLKDYIPSAQSEYKLTKYLRRNIFQRWILGDIVAFSVSFIMINFIDTQVEVRKNNPPFLLMFITSIFGMFNMNFSSHFLSGSEFSLDTRYAENFIHKNFNIKKILIF